MPTVYRSSLVAQLLKNLPANEGDMGSVPGLGRSPGEGTCNPLQYSCLGNPMDGGAWQATVPRVTRVGHKLASDKTTTNNHISLIFSKLSPYSSQSWRKPLGN